MREEDAGLKFEEAGLSADCPVKHFVRSFRNRSAVRMHYHNSLELNVCRNVIGTVRFESGERDLSDDCMLLIPPGIPHAYNLDESDGTIDVYHLLTRELPGVEAALGAENDYVMVAGISREGEHLLRELDRKDCSNMRRSGVILMLVDLFRSSQTRLNPVGNGADSFLKRVIEYSERNFHRRLGLDEISAQSGVSKFHFCRLFRRKSGENWSVYLNRLRLSESLRFLEKGHTVSETAEACGFESSSYYIRCFREEYSVTPLRWSRRALSGR